MDHPSPNVEEEEEDSSSSSSSSLTMQFASFSIRYFRSFPPHSPPREYGSYIMVHNILLLCVIGWDGEGREYTLRMRCSSSLRSFLPFRCEPMECPRFRWWASDLEATARSVLSPSAGTSGKSTVGRPHKRKKQRSIVELFAVAPHVDDVDEDDEEGEEDEDVPCDDRDELLQTLMRKRRGLLVVRSGGGGKIKNKDRIGKHQKQRFIKKAKKGKLHNAIVPSKTGLSQLLRGSVLRRCREEIKVPMDKKKGAKTQGSSKQRRVKAIQSSALLFKKKLRRSSALPIQGILKVPMKSCSANKAGKAVKSHNFDLTDHNKSKKAKRHVSFSDKNDIIGQKKKINSPVKISDALVVSAAQDKPVAEMPVAVNEMESNTTATSVDDTNRSLLDIRELSSDNQDNPRATNSSDNTRTCGVDLNHSPCGCGSSPFSNHCGVFPSSSNTCASSSEILDSVTRNGTESVMEYLLGGRFPMRPSITRMICSNDPPSTMDSSWSTLHEGSQLLGPCMPRIRGSNAQSCQSIHHVPNTSGIISQDDPSCHQLMPRIPLCPPTSLQVKEPILRLDPTATCQDRCNNGDLIGLPLNSQGEFIHWHSRDDQLKQNQNRFISSERNYSQNSVDYWNNLDHLMNKGKIPDTSAHLKERASQYPDPRFLQVNCIEQYQERANTFDHRVNHFDQRPCCGTCRKQNLMEGHASVQLIPMEGSLQNGFQPANQPTVRLMGKDVTIGADNSNFQGFLDRKKWLDKEIIFPRRSDHSTPNWFSQHKCLDSWSSGSLGNNVLCSMETGRSPRNFYEMAAIDPRLQHAHIEGGSQWTRRNAISFNKCHAFNWGSFAEQPPGILSNNTVNDSSKLMSPPAPYNSCIQIQPNSSEYQHSRIPFHVERPNFVQGGECQDHLILGNHTSQIVPPWLANMKSQKKFQDPSPSYPDVFSKHQPLRMSMADGYPLPTLHSMEFPCSSNATAYAFGPSINAIGSPPFMTMQSPMVNANQQEMQKGDFGMRPGFSYLQGPDQTMKTKRRLPSRLDDFTRPAKKPNSIMLSGPDFHETARDGLYTNTSMQCPSQVDLHGSRNRDVSIQEMTKNDAISAPGSDSPKLDGESRPGPTKLTAGAKHIIRPGRNVDPDNSIPVHSTIPFMIGSNTGKVLEHQSKSAKIYQF